MMPLVEVDNTLGTVIRYTWIGIGVLFALYVYFVGAITFSVIAERDLSVKHKMLVSETSAQEFTYLAQQRNLTKAYGLANGYSAPIAVSYAAPERAFAWNVTE